MPDTGYFAALIAGLLSFMSPCVLPMVPFYLSYMAGVSMGELRADGAIAPGARRRLVGSATAFAAGVTTIFVLLGLGATALGQVFMAWRESLSYLAAAILVLFGLHFLAVLRIPLLYRQAQISTEPRPATLLGAYLTGLAFGFGWTPCVGPALAAILMMASGAGSLAQGGSLLLVYGIGMTLPFILAAFFARPFLGWAQRNRKYLGHVEKLMGAMLILFGVLIATGGVGVIAQWMLGWFDWDAVLR